MEGAFLGSGRVLVPWALLPSLLAAASLPPDPAPASAAIPASTRAPPLAPQPLPLKSSISHTQGPHFLQGKLSQLLFHHPGRVPGMRMLPESLFEKGSMFQLLSLPQPLTLV